MPSLHLLIVLIFREHELISEGIADGRPLALCVLITSFSATAMDGDQDLKSEHGHDHKNWKAAMRQNQGELVLAETI
jgi:hypothetical protein